MVCLVKEDGTIVAGANTYIEYSDAETILDNIGETIEVTEEQFERYLLQACRILEGKKYIGSMVDSTQELQWPRSDVTVNGFDIAETTIPIQLQKAQAVIALTLSQGEQAEADVSDGKNVIQETIAGAISVTYANNGISGGVLRNPLIDQYLDPLLKKGYNLGVYRA
jgi:hypothetical protein